MNEFYDDVKHETFTTDNPLICVMDGALCLWNIFDKMFINIKHIVRILDIIHVLEYIWLIAHVKFKEGNDECKNYVYEKLLMILQGKVASYIMEPQKEMLEGKWNETQKEKFKKVHCTGQKIMYYSE
ncbi:MAG: hypothetical protein B6245_19940 [Desulfobacteraceae bacterium 4572_88]|nr:MAG: hypothetical protein B6245_19940 [Desulfobacteraceae bacterium 4572_88]